jgi:hypothetical protein
MPCRSSAGKEGSRNQATRPQILSPQWYMSINALPSAVFQVPVTLSSAAGTMVAENSQMTIANLKIPFIRFSSFLMYSSRVRHCPTRTTRPSPWLQIRLMIW